MPAVLSRANKKELYFFIELLHDKDDMQNLDKENL